jgi:hypothetical protein
MLTQSDFEKLLAPSTNSEAMLKRRAQYLAKLFRELKAEDFAILNNTRLVLKEIKSNSDNVNTWKTRIFHLMALLRTPQGKAVNTKAKEIYKKEAAKLKAQGLEAYKDNIMTEKQKERFISLNGLNLKLSTAIVDLFDEYGISRSDGVIISNEDILRWHDKKRKNIFTFARDLQSLALIACYVWQPSLRNDYSTLHITKKVVGLKNDRNWLQIKKTGEMNIIMNEYKNAKSMGKQTIKIEDEKLKWLLIYWLNLLTKLLGDQPKHLFYYSINAEGKIEYIDNKQSVSKAISRISEKVFDKPLSINDYRHIWESSLQSSIEYQRATQPEREEMHKKLLHGHMAALNYNMIRRDEVNVNDI